MVTRTQNVTIDAGAKPDGPSDGAPGWTWSKLKARAVHESTEFMAMFLYLFVVFLIINIDRYIALTQRGIDYRAYGFAVFNALVLAKVMLVAQGLGVGTRFRSRPPIYSIVYRSIGFGLFFIGFDIVEKVIVGLIAGKGVIESVPAIGGGGLKGIGLVWVITSICLTPFFAYRELARVMGSNELQALLLKTRPPPTPGDSVPPAKPQG